MEAKPRADNEVKTRNLQKNYSTEVQNPNSKQPLNSKFEMKRHASIGKKLNNEDATVYANGEVSILFSAVRNKTTNQMTSTFEGPTLQNMDRPVPPQLLIRRSAKEQEYEPESEQIVSKEGNHSEYRSEVQSHPYKPKVKKSRAPHRNLGVPPQKISRPYKSSKIKTNNTFQLRMENRRSLGNVTDNMHRPQSASILTKINARK